MELEINRVLCHKVYDTVGGHTMLSVLNATAKEISGIDLELYSMSGEWTWVDTIKVIKCRGEHGDLLVRLT
jgi:hypothetical protein